LPTLADGTIVLESVWKRFRADRSKPNLHDQMVKMGRRLRGGKRSYRWVLKDINFELEPGGTMGLIGINGSGKSTLLKVISRCMYQTAGRCETAGRIGALLEVRGGINPLLSGRENIFMFGSLLGLSRREINARFDTIAEFAEVTDAIDRQVKYYSSGMQVRLGFSIASHLDADILLVDEILAVGDANFQQKCLSRINELVVNGTTLLFVSHDLAAVEAMCERAMWLTEATTRAEGPTAAVLAQYRGAIEEFAASASDEETSSLRVLKVEVTGPDDGMARSGEDVLVRLVLSAPGGGAARVFVGISEGTAVPVFVARHETDLPAGEFEVRCNLRSLPLPRGRYYVWLAVEGGRRNRAVQGWKPIATFDVFGPNRPRPPKGVMVLSPVLVPATWELS
jgi:ABC-type polysaccharide/polyol phosphate transport system ATPase subunit